MQISQQIRRGDLVELRRQRWRVDDIRSYESCRLLSLTGVGARNRGIGQRFLVPFDLAVLIDRQRGPRIVSARRWRRACRAILADHTPPGCLRVARHARIDLLPHQLEPALAVVRGSSTRILLADDVGLGKTIQAGLIAAELQARGVVERVLVITPAGLRDQWRTELQTRFGLDATVVGHAALRRQAAALPVGLNPWATLPLAIASVDYIKRPEILHSVRSCHWDLVIVDEAHGAGAGSDRYSAVCAIAERSPYVLLLTATPHHGDSRAFAALCNVGARDDSVLVFRRTKAQVHVGTGRHIHTLHVRPTPAEKRMFALLTAFAAAVRAEHDWSTAWLALSVLHKRAFSSPRSLALTIERRLRALGAHRDSTSQQLALPWVDGSGETDRADEAPDCLETLALSDQDHERALLGRLLEASGSARRDDSKVAALGRLLRRIAEPVLVFTEFRDTLLHLRDRIGEPVAILHGGLTRDERSASVDDFTRGRRRILLATDAAGEGLNLHHRCRTVVNLELPWNPTRLEQRIGRVDRIGQTRRVEAFHLVGRETGEGRVLERLKERIASAARDIEGLNPIDDERSIARAVIDPDTDTPAPVEEPPPSQPADGRIVVEMAAAAHAEAARLSQARMRATSADGALVALLETSNGWIARARLRATRARLGSRGIAVVRVDDSRSPVAEVDLVALTFVCETPFSSFKDRRALVDRIGGDLKSAAENIVRQTHDASTSFDQFLACHLARRRRIVHSLAVPVSLVQRGLFDRRAERAEAALRAAQGDAGDDNGRGFDASRWLGGTPDPRGRLLLVLLP